VPHEDFTEFCAQLALMIHESGIAVGPAVDEAVIAMMDHGLDPFTYYVPPDQAGSFRANGLVGGVGLLLDATDAVGSRCAMITATCPLQIVFVLEDNPGADSGLQAGDLIVEVDGVRVEGKGFTATAAAIAGDETGQVEVVVERAGEPLTFTIARSELTVPTVQVDLPMPNVGYLRIPDFEDDIPGLVSEALISLSEFDPGTIVVDLRDNPGGFIDVSVDVASEFISGGLVLESFGPDEHLEYTATDGGLATKQRLIVLVNRGTASAAEIVAGALRDRRGAVIIGTNTFGKDAVQIPFMLRNGGELYVVVARWATPNGQTAGNGGLTPDRELELTTEMSIEEVVEAAIDAAS
jgi:carboxyl-terminal processing protease